MPCFIISSRHCSSVSNLRQSRRLGVVNRSKRFVPLVPKLYLGTHLSAKLCFPPGRKQRSCGDTRVPKYNLGTRKERSPDRRNGTPGMVELGEFPDRAGGLPF